MRLRLRFVAKSLCYQRIIAAFLPCTDAKALANPCDGYLPAFARCGRFRILKHASRPGVCRPFGAEFDTRLDEIIREEQWIIDGNYQRTLEKRLQACDTVFFLDFPLEVCLSGAAARIGKRREDLPWIEEELDAEFKQWILDFSQNSLPQMVALLAEYRKSKEIILFQLRQEADDYVQRLPHHR